MKSYDFHKCGDASHNDDAKIMPAFGGVHELYDLFE
jgi:hypothetical protein